MLEIIHDGKGQRLVYSHNNVAIGQCSIFPSAYVTNAIELWAFGVYGEYRGRGHGQTFLNEIIKQYHGKIIVLFVEKSNTRALHIYTKMGFTITGDYRGGDYAWEMRLEA
jgi:ribosomal protein S18 acetylase RimI-like enzyme